MAESCFVFVTPVQPALQPSISCEYQGMNNINERKEEQYVANLNENSDVGDAQKNRRRQGKTIPGDKRAMIWRDHKLLMEEFLNRFGNPHPRSSEGQRIAVMVRKQICQTAGIDRKTYLRIIEQGKNAEEEGREVQTPGKKRPHPAPKADLIDGFLIDAVRRKVMQLYLDGDHPNSKQLCAYATQELGYTGKLHTFVKCMRTKMGYRYRRVNGKNFLLERHEIVQQRYEFLRKWRMYKDMGRPFVYLGETWVWERHATHSSWQAQGIHGVRGAVGKGRRLFLLHAGSTNGFVPNAQLMFVPNVGQADYRKDMNAVAFTKWFQEQLLPNIPAQSVIYMDNAAYRSTPVEKIPNINSRKLTMIEWLLSRGVPSVNASMLKAELFTLVKQHRPHTIRYVIDNMAIAAGHAVVRIPPYHSQFNPIELVWAHIKNAVGLKNQTFKVTDVLRLTEEEIGNFESGLWAGCVRHAEGLCQEYYDKDPIIEIHVEKIIIQQGVEETETETDNDTDTEQ